MAGKSKARETIQDEESAAVTNKRPNSIWFLPIMIGFLVLGLLWIIVFYISQGLWPIQAIGAWNIVVGLGIATVGFAMTTRWR